MLAVFLALPDSFIIVDEPELFLNPSIYNRLWTELEKSRPDCRFVYVSHCLDFIESRINSDVLWCKSYDHNLKKWELERLDFIQMGIPKDLFLQVTGAKKNIIFCEGNSKNSLDYMIYSMLFPDYSVIGAGSCSNVIHTVTAYNNYLHSRGNVAYGIIDRDFRDDVQITELMEKKIYVLPFTEVEMLLATPEVISEVIGSTGTAGLIEQVKGAILDKIMSNNNRIKQMFIQKQVNEFLNSMNYDVKKESEENLNNIQTRTADFFADSISKAEQLTESIMKGDFSNALSLCPLKHKEIYACVEQVINTRKYTEKAIISIRNVEQLRTLIKSNYFSDFINDIL